jgi:hypothetical protein
MPGMTLGVVASWRWLYLAAKPSHMEVDVDGLACPLAPSCGLLLLDEGSRLLVRHSLVLSCRSIWWHLSGIAGPPRAWIFDGWVPVLPSFTWSTSFHTRTCFTLWQNHCGADMHIPGRTTILEGDRSDPST